MYKPNVSGLKAFSWLNYFLGHGQEKIKLQNRKSNYNHKGTWGTWNQNQDRYQMWRAVLSWSAWGTLLHLGKNLANGRHPKLLLPSPQPHHPENGFPPRSTHNPSVSLLPLQEISPFCSSRFLSCNQIKLWWCQTGPANICLLSSPFL